MSPAERSDEPSPSPSSVRAPMAALRAAGLDPSRLALVVTLAAALLVVGRRYEPAMVAALAVLGSIVVGVVEAALAAWGAWRSRTARVVRAIVPLAIVVGVTTAEVWPAYAGTRRMFLDQDHPTQLANATYFLQQLAKGRFSQWSNLWNGGDAISDMYGWGGNLIVAAFRALSFGKLSIERAYVDSVAFTFTATSLGIYAFARRFSRRWIAVGVAILPISQWYWHQPLHMGSWHAQLSTVLALYACAKVVDVVRRGRARDVMIGALALFAAALVHTYALLVVAFVGAPLLVGALLASPSVRRRAPVGGLVFAIGLGLAAFWLVPMTRALADNAIRWPLRGYDHDAGLQKLFGAPTITALFFSGAAIVACVGHRDRVLRGIAFGLLGTMLVQAVGVEAELRLVGGSFGRAMQWFRLEAVVVLGAPVAMAAMLEAALARAPKRPLAWPVVLRRAAFASLVAIGLPVLASAFHTERAGMLAHAVGRVRQQPAALSGVEAALEHRRLTDPAWPFRVLWAADLNIQESLGVGFRAGVPIVTRPYMPCLFNRNRLHDLVLDATRAWGVKYIVGDGGYAPNAPYVLDETIGPYKIYRDDGFGGLVKAPPGVDVAIESFTDPEVRLRVRGAPPEGVDVRLAIAHYPRLRAWQDGAPIEVRAVPERPGAEPNQVGLHVRDGVVVLRPSAALPGTFLGFAISLASLVALGAVVAFGRSQRVRERIRETWRRIPLDAWTSRLDRAPPRVAAAVAIGASLVAVGALALPRPRLASPLPRTFGGDRDLVRRTTLEGEPTPACFDDPTLRAWFCPVSDPKESAAEAATRVELSTAGDPPAPPDLWFLGTPWTALRVEEHDGRAIVHVRLRRFARGRFLHVRMDPATTGGPTSLAVSRPGGASTPIAIVHGWTTVPAPADADDTLEFSLRFERPGTLSFVPVLDDDARNPAVAKQQ